MLYRIMAGSFVALAATSLTAQSAQAAGQASPGETDKQRIERLERTVEDLSRRLSQQEAAKTAAPQPQAPPPQAAQSQSVAETLPPKTESAGNNHLELYGFVQLDAIQDFKRVDPNWDSTLRPSKIPTTKGAFGSDGQSIFSAKQSRLGAKATGEIAGNPYEAKFEFDLYGTGVDAGQTTMRVRHAYASWGPVLAGQTNSLFMDGDLFPNTVDYWGPAGMVFVRNPQLRFTFVKKDGWLAAVALEHPSDDIDPGAIRLIDPDLATNLRPNEELPDFTAQVRYEGAWGHVQLSGLLRKIGYDTAGTVDNKPTGSQTGWGLNLGTSFKASLATFRVGAVYGEGIASYMNDGGMDLAPRAMVVPAPVQPIFPTPPPANLLLSAKAVPLLGVTAYVDLQWSPVLTSALGYSFTRVDNTNFQEGSAFHKGEYASGNLLWAPAPPILTGLELLWGQRTDNNGAKGDDVRMQFTFKFSFSSKDIWGN